MQEKMRKSKTSSTNSNTLRMLSPNHNPRIPPMSLPKFGHCKKKHEVNRILLRQQNIFLRCPHQVRRPLSHSLVVELLEVHFHVDEVCAQCGQRVVGFEHFRCGVAIVLDGGVCVRLRGPLDRRDLEAVRRLAAKRAITARNVFCNLKLFLVKRWSLTRTCSDSRTATRCLDTPSTRAPCSQLHQNIRNIM